MTEKMLLEKRMKVKNGQGAVAKKRGKRSEKSRYTPRYRIFT